MYHKVVLVGNLGKDPEMRYTQGGAAVCNFSVATTNRVNKEATPNCPEGWKESFNKKAWEQTVWWRVTTWRKLAEICNEFLAKGRTVYIEGEMNGSTVNGSLNPRVWTGSDGVAKASFEITARVVKFMGGGRNEETQSDTSQEQEPPGHQDEDDAGIPF